jgi:DNA-binding NarL/FixJ family response regulator
MAVNEMARAMPTLRWKGKELMNGHMEMVKANEPFSAAAAYAGKEHELKPIRIWMVDDSANLRMLLRSLLASEEGFDCDREFENPPAVLKALAEDTPPDVILLDIQMGAYNGLDAIRPIKLLAPSAHVLMLTTLATPEVRERAYREGASDFMLKSWSLDEMVAHIRQAVEYGSVAGLLTAFLCRERPSTVQREPAPVAGKTSLLDRWQMHLRGMLKFSPS